MEGLGWPLNPGSGPNFLYLCQSTEVQKGSHAEVVFSNLVCYGEVQVNDIDRLDWGFPVQRETEEQV